MDWPEIFRYHTEAQAAKEKIDKLDFIKIKNICASKSTTREMIQNPTKWKKIFSSHIFVKGLVFKILNIYKELLQLSDKPYLSVTIWLIFINCWIFFFFFWLIFGIFSISIEK